MLLAIIALVRGVAAVKTAGSTHMLSSLLQAMLRTIVLTGVLVLVERTL